MLLSGQGGVSPSHSASSRDKKRIKKRCSIHSYLFSKLMILNHELCCTGSSSAPMEESLRHTPNSCVGNAVHYRVLLDLPP